MIKHSRQRESILEFIRMTDKHPTADEIYSSLKVDMQDLSLATVYRNLKFLSANGDIIRLDTGENVDRYDGNTFPHDHFICEKCSRVYDMPTLLKCDFSKMAGDGFEVKKHSLYLYGLCDKCSL